MPTFPVEAVEVFGRGVLKEYHMRLVVFDINTEEISQWIPEP